MEENNLKKEKSNVGRMNTNSKGNKNTIIAILSVVIVIAIGVGLYFCFIKKDNSYEGNSNDNKQNVVDNYSFTKVERIKLNSTNKEVKVNGKNIKLKVIDGILYINDNNTNIEVFQYYEDGSDVGITDIDVSDYLMFLYGPSDNEHNPLKLVIDENGKKIQYDNSMYENYDNETPVPVSDVMVEDGKLIAREYTVGLFDATYPYNIYEIKYKNSKITFDLINGEFKLTSDNRKFVIDGKEVLLKVIDGTLYVNDIKQEEVHLEDIVFVADKYILIEQHGQCGIAIDYAVDASGKVIKVSKNIEIGNSDNKDYQLQIIRKENDRFVAELPTSCYCYETFYDNNKCSVGYKEVEFSYDGSNLTLKELGK